MFIFVDIRPSFLVFVDDRPSCVDFFDEQLYFVVHVMALSSFPSPPLVFNLSQIIDDSGTFDESDDANML